MSANTPRNPPATAYKPDACAAFGCPMWGAIKRANEWVCDCHALAEPEEWQAVTLRLNNRRDLLRAIHRAMQPGRREGWAERAAAHMAKIGHPELAPTVVTIRHHQFRHRHTGQPLVLECQRDEREHIALWVARLRRVLFAECVNPSGEPLSASPPE